MPSQGSSNFADLLNEFSSDEDEIEDPKVLPNEAHANQEVDQTVSQAASVDQGPGATQNLNQTSNQGVVSGADVSHSPGQVAEQNQNDSANADGGAAGTAIANDGGASSSGNNNPIPATSSSNTSSAISSTSAARPSQFGGHGGSADARPSQFGGVRKSQFGNKSFNQFGSNTNTNQFTKREDVKNFVGRTVGARGLFLPGSGDAAANAGQQNGSNNNANATTAVVSNPSNPSAPNVAAAAPLSDSDAVSNDPSAADTRILPKKSTAQPLDQKWASDLTDGFVKKIGNIEGNSVHAKLERLQAKRKLAFEAKKEERLEKTCPHSGFELVDRLISGRKFDEAMQNKRKMRLWEIEGMVLVPPLREAQAMEKAGGFNNNGSQFSNNNNFNTNRKDWLPAADKFRNVDVVLIAIAMVYRREHKIGQQIGAMWQICDLAEPWPNVVDVQLLGEAYSAWGSARCATLEDQKKGSVFAFLNPEVVKMKRRDADIHVIRLKKSAQIIKLGECSNIGFCTKRRVEDQRETCGQPYNINKKDHNDMCWYHKDMIERKQEKERKQMALQIKYGSKGELLSGFGANLLKTASMERKLGMSLDKAGSGVVVGGVVAGSVGDENGGTGNKKSATHIGLGRAAVAGGDGLGGSIPKKFGGRFDPADRGVDLKSIIGSAHNRTALPSNFMRAMAMGGSSSAGGNKTGGNKSAKNKSSKNKPLNSDMNHQQMNNQINNPQPQSKSEQLRLQVNDSLQHLARPEQARASSSLIPVWNAPTVNKKTMDMENKILPNLKACFKETLKNDKIIHKDRDKALAKERQKQRDLQYLEIHEGIGAAAGNFLGSAASRLNDSIKNKAKPTVSQNRPMIARGLEGGMMIDVDDELGIIGEDPMADDSNGIAGIGGGLKKLDLAKIKARKAKSAEEAEKKKRKEAEVARKKAEEAKRMERKEKNAGERSDGKADSNTNTLAGAKAAGASVAKAAPGGSGASSSSGSTSTAAASSTASKSTSAASTKKPEASPSAPVPGIKRTLGDRLKEARDAKRRKVG